jgi:response regulator RpfG family c-di-GMP phosphodiesterase
MKSNILFLDDEQSVLNGIQRRLGFDYDMTCCTSGAESLRVIEELGPFAAIVTDMRMPEMNGIQFIKQARMVAPDSVYLMLTGNQDQATAIQAMNEGQVFRFLNKPCDHDALKRALDAALHQYRLVTAEKELLHKTFVGAIGVLTEVLEIGQPAIYSQATYVEELVNLLANAVCSTQHWEYKLAARMSLIGLSLLSEHERAYLEIGTPTDMQYLELYRRSIGISARLIEKIPRLSIVAQIISTQMEIDGSLQFHTNETNEEVIHVGATLLRVATFWNSLMRIGIGPNVAAQELRAMFPEINHALLHALEQWDGYHQAHDVVRIEVPEVREGMILAEDVVATDQCKLMRQGQRLSKASVEKLRVYHETVAAIRPIGIFESSFQAALALA